MPAAGAMASVFSSGLSTPARSATPAIATEWPSFGQLVARPRRTSASSAGVAGPKAAL